MRRFGSLVGLACAVLACVGGVTCCSTSESRHESWQVGPTEADLGSLTPGDYDVVVTVTNAADAPRRVLGLTEGCRENCCFRSGHRYPVSVPPHGVFDYHIVFTAYKPGPFDVTLGLHLEEEAVHTVMITIRGACHEAVQIP